MQAKSLSRLRLFAIPLTVACQAPLSAGFSRQEYLSRLLFPSPGNPPDPGIKPGYSALAGGLLNTSVTREANGNHIPQIAR